MKKFLIGCLLLITACNLGSQTAVTESAATQTLLSSSIPVTATETLVLTSTSTSTPEPPPLYFTDEFISESPYWEFFQTGGINFPTTTFTNDALQINISSPDTWMIGIHNVNTYSNVFIRTKISVNPTGSLGLICGYDESSWFEFNVASDGTYNVLLGQWLAQGIAKYIPLTTDASNQLNSPNLNYEIGLACQDNFLLLYINETLLRRIDVTNYGLTEGKIGITASSLKESPTTALFEWVQVSEE